MTDLPRDIEHELAALADGSLAPKRREQAHARVRDSRELQAALAEQQRAVELMGAVEVCAPASLHRQVEGMIGTARRRRRLATMRVGLAAATSAALAAIAVAIALSGGTSSGFSVQRAAALTLSPATTTAPVEDEAHRAQLVASVDGVPFPYWEERFGWRGSGARSDRLAGRSVMTVFYSNAEGRRIGYAIASGRAPITHGGTVIKRWGVSYRVLSQDGATVVSWQRAGHLCVVSGRGVNARTLLGLASWGSERRHSA
jgi:anti-sigma factor RsiW